MMMWALIGIIMYTTGTITPEGHIQQIKVGQYKTYEACKREAKYYTSQVRLTMIGTSIRNREVETICIPVGE